MDRETEKLFEDLFEMFATDGWKHMMEIVNKDLEALNANVWTVKDKDEIMRLQGHRGCLIWLSGYRDAMEIAYEEATKVEEDDADL